MDALVELQINIRERLTGLESMALTLLWAIANGPWDRSLRLYAYRNQSQLFYVANAKSIETFRDILVNRSWNSEEFRSNRESLEVRLMFDVFNSFEERTFENTLAFFLEKISGYNTSTLDFDA